MKLDKLATPRNSHFVVDYILRLIFFCLINFKIGKQQDIFVHNLPVYLFINQAVCSLMPCKHFERIIMLGLLRLELPQKSNLYFKGRNSMKLYNE